MLSIFVSSMKKSKLYVKNWIIEADPLGQIVHSSKRNSKTSKFTYFLDSSSMMMILKWKVYRALHLWQRVNQLAMNSVQNDMNQWAKVLSAFQHGLKKCIRMKSLHWGTLQRFHFESNSIVQWMHAYQMWN